MFKDIRSKFKVIWPTKLRRQKLKNLSDLLKSIALEILVTNVEQLQLLQTQVSVTCYSKQSLLIVYLSEQNSLKCFIIISCTFFTSKFMHTALVSASTSTVDQDPDGEIENSGKSIFEIQIPNFFYIQDITLFIFFTFSHGSGLAKSQPLPMVDS